MAFNSTELILTGGLGNQLFQIGAALSLVPENSINCDWVLGKPRLNVDGQPEVSSFVMPEQIKIREKRKNSFLVSKAIGFQLRKGISPTLIERLPGFDLATKLLSAIVTHRYFRKFRWPAICRGVGYSELSISKKSSVLIGYFQSYRWVSEPRVRLLMQSLKLKSSNQDIDLYRNLALLEKPLIVHIRLGDYVGHDAFGIPSPKYFVHSINEIMGLGITEKIWLFSDEPEKARDLLREIDNSLIRIVPEISGSASSTLEVMRFGLAYVTSNSTFSWWAAFISYTENPFVITPSPWFKSQEEPIDFIPPDWHRRDASFL